MYSNFQYYPNEYDNPTNGYFGEPQWGYDPYSSSNNSSWFDQPNFGYWDQGYEQALPNFQQEVPPHLEQFTPPPQESSTE